MESATVLRPIAGVHVFHDHDTALGHGGEEFLSGRNLLFHAVTAVVDDDVDDTEFRTKLLQKPSIGLITDPDIETQLAQLGCPGIDVNPNDAGAAAEVFLPHLHRPAVVNAKFDHHNGTVSELRQVSVVNIEIVRPLVYQLIACAHRVFFKRAHRNMVHGGILTGPLQGFHAEHSGAGRR